MARPIAPLEERRLLAIALALVTFAVFTVIDSSAKWLVEAGIPAHQVTFQRYAIHLLLISAFVLPTQGFSVLRTVSLPTELLRAAGLLATTLLNFLAVQFLPLTVTGAVAFSMPLIVCALSGPMLGEKVGPRRWAAILVGFVGVMIVIRPGGTDFNWAVMLSLASAAAASFYFILTRKLAGRDSASTMQIYTGLVGTIAVAPFALASWIWPSDPATWLAFFLVGIAGLAGHFIYTIAHRFAPASVLAPFAYTQIIYMTLSSWLIFSDPPDVWLFVGAPIVIASGLYIWLRERQLAKATPTAVVPEATTVDASDKGTRS